MYYIFGYLVSNQLQEPQILYLHEKLWDIFSRPPGGGGHSDNDRSEGTAR